MDKIILSEKYSLYDFAILEYEDDDNEKHYYYIIYTNEPNYITCKPDEIESDEYYDTAQEAKFAAIGHINLLENGEG